MQKREEANFNMFRAVYALRSDYSTLISSIPALASGFNDLQARISNISGLVSLQAAVISGIAIDKENLKAKMAILTYNYSGAARAWAAGNKDDTTYEALNLVQSVIKKKPDEVAGPACLNIYNIMNANAAALLPFGLTAAMLSELNTTISDYIAIVPLPANAINIRQTYTDNIIKSVRQGADFLKRQLDNIVRAQINANPGFVKTYFNSREIIDPPTNSTTFKITVWEDDGTGKPGAQAVSGARCEVIGIADKVTHTDSEGKAALSKFKKGNYTLLVTADGYAPVQRLISIGLGETKEVAFILIRNE
jgi:hypothetical protein